ncbi:MAG: putative addiction module antidote protein [Alphaproteobacteria bacterium]|nr:putative addiction module antidote protein [Alphaproteobacteria bacterium]
MKNYRSLASVEKEYFQTHPEEMDAYMALIFEEYAKDGDVGALLSSLRTLSQVKGVTRLAQETGLSRKGIQKALSEDGNPAFVSIHAIMKSMGYRLEPRKVE